LFIILLILNRDHNCRTFSWHNSERLKFTHSRCYASRNNRDVHEAVTLPSSRWTKINLKVRQNS